MIIEVDKSFSKDFEKITDTSLKQNVIKITDNIEKQTDLRTQGRLNRK